MDGFETQEVIVLEKLDGENTSLYKDAIHARSLSSGHHPSRTWVKTLQGSMGYRIPEGWRICGENVYACHSIHYTALTSYFMSFQYGMRKMNVYRGMQQLHGVKVRPCTRSSVISWPL